MPLRFFRKMKRIKWIVIKNFNQMILESLIISEINGYRCKCSFEKVVYPTNKSINKHTKSFIHQRAIAIQMIVQRKFEEKFACLEKHLDQINRDFSLKFQTRNNTILDLQEQLVIARTELATERERHMLTRSQSKRFEERFDQLYKELEELTGRYRLR